MQPEQEDKVVEALEAAEAKARGVLERLLGDRASTYNIILKLEDDRRGGYRLLVDIEASRPRAKWIEAVVEEAVNEAVREFEKRVRGARRSNQGKKMDDPNTQER